MNQIVSIIIPIYNTSKYLRKCLDSIVNQSYENIEIVLVDDGSTDNSLVICNEFAAKDTRVKIIHKANGGVSSARNTGLENSSGEWIAFVDSDDWIETDYVSRLISESDGQDIIICNSSLKKIYTGQGIADFIRTGIKTFSGTSSCFKLIKVEIIKRNDVIFNCKFSYGEDTIFSLNLLPYCHSIKMLDYRGYHVRHSNTVVTEKYNQSIEDIHAKITAIRKIHDVLGQQYNCTFDISRDIRLTIMMFPMSRILNGENKVYEQLWMSYFPNSSVNALYYDRCCSPLIRSITILKSLTHQRRHREAYFMARKCYSTWGSYYNKIQIPYPSHRLIGYLIGKNHLVLMMICLFLYSTVRRQNL